MRTTRLKRCFLMDKNIVNVYKDGKAVTIDKNSLAVFLKFGYELKTAPVTDKKGK